MVKGSMRERGAGRWQLRAYAGLDPITGKTLYRTRAFKGTKRQAQSALAHLVTEVDSGVVAPSAKTVAVLLDGWLTHIEYLGRSPSTLYGYQRLVAQLPDDFKSLRGRRRGADRVRRRRAAIRDSCRRRGSGRRDRSLRRGAGS
jgi:hypothetical protein